MQGVHPIAPRASPVDRCRWNPAGVPVAPRPRMTTVDPQALREELSLPDPADPTSGAFLRFVMRLSEALDVDVAPADYPTLATLAGTVAWLQSHLPPEPETRP